jgi:hypothetical protein
MIERTCEACLEKFTPHQQRRNRIQRFCCRVCSDAWFADERRAAVEFFRRNRGEATAADERREATP